MDFLLNNFKLEKQTIIAHPNLRAFSIDKTICPRHGVLMILLSKKLIVVNKMCWLITISKEKFLENYVINVQKRSLVRYRYMAVLAMH